LPDSVTKNRVASGRGAEGIPLIVSKMIRVSKSGSHTATHLPRSGSRNGFRFRIATALGCRIASRLRNHTQPTPQLSGAGAPEEERQRRPEGRPNRESCPVNAAGRLLMPCIERCDVLA
jgi:hypothetical protein